MQMLQVSFILLVTCLLAVVTKTCSRDDCDSSNAADGGWHVSPTKRENGITLFCPNTFLEIDSTYQGSYICTGRSGAFKQASFEQDSCTIMKTEDSFDILKKHTVIFVGDSIMMQRWYALKCIIEGRKDTANVQLDTKFFYSRFLRRSMACKHKSSQAGDDCNNDWLAIVSSEISDSKSQRDSDISLVVNIGSWFDGMSKIAHHKDYAEIVEEYAAILGGFVKKGITVVWIDLPPMVFDSADKYWHQHRSIYVHHYSK